MVGARRDEGVDERRGVGVHVKDGAEFACDEFQDPTHAIPPFPPPTPAAFAAHTHLLSWFLDALAAPFGVHRMALAGKTAEKDVGMWFGSSPEQVLRNGRLSAHLLPFLHTPLHLPHRPRRQ
ncbi:hypothetical protein B0H17DRAFT_1107964 [Mycena rosella]|uniref:Cysteine protease n=1 Tax=Mycena rosella TaxID=1033263 RepID=A0AAD7FRA6_MYCRO|nr:hypothetical protein B0H17DRAFT_1107964 [Mycena rosella]